MVVAAAIGNYEGLSALLKLGVSPNSSYSSPSSSVCNLYKSTEFERRVSLVESAIRFDNLAVPLLAAVSFYMPECAKLLLNSCANPNILSKKGNSPLSYAAKQGHVEMVRLLYDTEPFQIFVMVPVKQPHSNMPLKIITQNVSKYCTSSIQHQGGSCLPILSEIRTSQVKEVFDIGGFYTYAKIPGYRDWYPHTKSNNLLQHLCRLSIRKHLVTQNPKINLFHVVPKLSLPPNIKNFILCTHGT